MISNKKYTMSDTDLKELVARFWSAFLGHKDSIDRIDLTQQFEAPSGELVKINAAVLICLCGEKHPLFQRAWDYLSVPDAVYGEQKKTYLKFYEIIQEEIVKRIESDAALVKVLRDAIRAGDPDRLKAARLEIFNPLAAKTLSRFDAGQIVNDIQKQNRLRLIASNENFIANPIEEVIFTTNVLVTAPRSESLIPGGLTGWAEKSLKSVIGLPVDWYFDHPMEMATTEDALHASEFIFCLRKLEETFHSEIEIEKTAWKDHIREGDKVPLYISISPTHGQVNLGTAAREVLKCQYTAAVKSGILQELKIVEPYLYSQADVKHLINDVLRPAAKRYFPEIPDKEIEGYLSFFGLEGYYAMHYNFLKAFGSLAKFMNPRVKAVIKIDTDQSFPAKRFYRETGSCWLESFTLQALGGLARDQNERNIYLGCFAGSLTNRDELIDKDDLFLPDISIPDVPESIPEGEAGVFYQGLLQSLITRGEAFPPEVQWRALKILNEYPYMRTFVTGGTTGFLIEALERYAPFVDAHVHRAEDQAFLLSVLFDEYNGNLLRYLYFPGLHMIHEKESFAAESIKIAEPYKKIYDLERIWNFSFLARALCEIKGWAFEDVKRSLNFFTASFIHPFPGLLALTRFVLSVAGRGGRNREDIIYQKEGLKRLSKIAFSQDRYYRETRTRVAKQIKAWRFYYDLMIRLRESAKKGDPFALALKRKAIEINNNCKLIQ
ncbi:MAG: hypothetical protein JRJ38_00830 [Deltaproteobacteria bacterium]|nr:hypothetical protein [Deltaproteobacteria bacterium]